MELTEHSAGSHHVIRSISESAVRIDNDSYDRSLVLGARYLHADWPVRALDDLNEQLLAPLIDPQPELVIIGIGSRHQMLDIKWQRHFASRGIGIECMTLHAAARTFNVLMSEDRRALAGLIFGGR